MRTLGKRKGAVLIVVLGVLAVLALLATTFATLQATEKEVARNYLDTVRAKMLAQSGVQDAEARLREFFPFQYFNTVNPTAPRPWKYWGKDTTPWEQKEPMPQDKLEAATNPSFAVEDEPIQNPRNARVNPKQITIEGRRFGLSGFFGTNSYALHGDHYALKISDISGRIYVNDGLDGGPNGSVSLNLKRIINILGDSLQIPLLGDKILASRPSTGYRSPQDLLKAVGYDDATYQRIKDHVTVYAWVDPNVVNPVPLSAQMAAQMEADTRGVKYYRGNPPIYRFTSSKDAKGIEIYNALGLDTVKGSSKATENPAACIYGLDVLNPQWIEVVSRAPVNVNAASREVLMSLLTDLRGFYVSDRRRNNPRWKGDLYLSFKQQNTFSRAGTEGDEVGYLMETIPIVGPGGTQTTGISAFEIADELISCRNRQAGKYGNYANEPFGGPFRNWAQFYAFVDHLVAAGLLNDNRPSLHMDYEQEVDDPAGFGNLVPSDVQKEAANQALADVIKANFNPNCHLNELNPDTNLHLRVDKTDLLCNSTEFTFVPTGFFEIESLGRVLRPKDPAVGDSYLGDNDLVAQAKVSAVYKLYDLYRETSQKQFYAGTLPARTGAFETNGNMSLEIGPEPDNGKFAGNLGAAGDPDNEWSGYIAFPTVGGVGHSSAAKAKNTLRRTAQISSGPQFNSVAHGHFEHDMDLHQHPFDIREIASTDNADEHVENYSSTVNGTDLPYKRPYAPVSGPVVNETPIHRLAKSFKQTMTAGSGTVTSPSLVPYAPSDLRIDGAYSERHSSPAYYAFRSTQALWDNMLAPAQAGTTARSTGMVSFWFKPSFFPNLTGKVRSTWDFSRYHRVCGQNVNIWPWAMWFYPTHYNVATAESNGPKYWHNNQGQFHPSSLAWGSKQWHNASGGWLPEVHEFGNLSNSLNHLDHVKDNPACATKPSPLKGHHWINTTITWQFMGTDQNQTTSKMYINGNTLYLPFTYTTMTGGWGAGHNNFWNWDKHDGGESNHLRLGATSKIADAAVTTIGAYKGNYSGDHTVDEFYAWKSSTDADPLTLWLRGRYYKPLDKAYGEGIFVSQALSFVSTNPRTAAPPTSIPTPGGMGGAPGSVPTIAPQIRVLGLSWTWYGEGIDPNTGLQTLYDYNTPLGIAVSDVKPRVLAGIRDGNASYGPFDNDGFSAVRAPDGTIPVIQDPKQLKYFTQFTLDQANLSTILLATPVLDDITIYWDDSRTHLLSYAFDNRSF